MNTRMPELVTDIHSVIILLDKAYHLSDLVINRNARYILHHHILRARDCLIHASHEMNNYMDAEFRKSELDTI